MNENNVKNVDGLLRVYFQTEMPHPWPEWREPEAKLSSRIDGVSWGHGRWAVAASIALLLAGYLALAGLFPRETNGRLHDTGSGNIANRPMPAVPQK
jgi:hypothetical protein